jgi:hypothetical protein
MAKGQVHQHTKGSEGVNGEYIVYKCKHCILEFIMPIDGVRRAEVMNTIISCPLCHGGVSKVGAYEDLKQCMEKVNTYERKNGRIVQTRYK